MQPNTPSLADLCTELLRAPDDQERVAAVSVQIVQAAEQAAPSERDAAITSIADMLKQSDPLAGRMAALAGGALVEMGAVPDALIVPVFDHFGQVLHAAAAFVDEWQRSTGEPLPDPETPRWEGNDGVQAAMPRVVGEFGESAFVPTISWWLLSEWMAPAQALLSHSGKVRTQVPDAGQLLAEVTKLAENPAIAAMPDRRHSLHHLVELLSGGESSHQAADPIEAAEQELTTARALAQRGDLRSAANHLGSALLAAPDLPAVHQALHEFAAEVGPGVLDLFPAGEEHGAFLGHAIGRAHLLAASDPNEALGWLLSASRHDPSRPWANVPWVRDPAVAARLHPDRLAPDLAGFAASLPTPVPEEQRPPLSPYLDLCRNLVATHQNHALIHGATANLARRLGATGEAIRWAEQGERLAPSEMSALFTALAYQSAGDIDNAVAGYRRVLSFNPDNTAAYTDVAELLAEHDRLEEAIAWVERALAIEPADRAAFPTACALRFRRDGDAAHLIALADYLRTHPDVEHAHHMLRMSCADRPWLSHVPMPAAAGTNGMAAALENDSPVVSMSCTELEPPSVSATLMRVFPGITMDVLAIPAPDIRMPCRQVSTQVWSYRDTTPYPAVPAPSAESARAVAEFASLAMLNWPYPSAVYEASVHLAVIPVADLLGALVHPIDPPDSETGRQLAEPMLTPLWIRMVQVTACVGLLHHRGEQPWPGSARRALLVDLAFGVEDWVAEAALFALAVAAWVDPAARQDVAMLVSERLADAAAVRSQRVVTIAESLSDLALAVPGLPRQTIDIAVSLREE